MKRNPSLESLSVKDLGHGVAHPLEELGLGELSAGVIIHLLAQQDN